MKLRICAGLLLLAATLQAWADEAPAQAAMCTACHGAQGQGSAQLGAPRLAGQHADYLLTQLLNFKAGRRGYDTRDPSGAQMRAVIAALSDSDLDRLARYFAVQKVAAGEVTQVAGTAQGEAIYQGTCAACHGPKAEGFAHLKTPNLSILDGGYLERQLSNYIHGLRGSEVHADELGIWMRGISLQIGGESERKAIVDYITSLSAAPTH
ncbi:c-type cytochrome [Pseudomonas aeruginosa]|uniref:c-type cytochrome n=1 Tax=Pseudomonas aeruginosa TaxID=287 RepID=UPI00115F2FD4|nr:c-type cytochrome [Pseudomonas aeruginosa]MDT8222657.1 c-type cytochrome [Pseudomonas aeruginosa]TRL94178.1 cytochrome c [Pseudomonas aeruginosa]